MKYFLYAVMALIITASSVSAAYAIESKAPSYAEEDTSLVEGNSWKLIRKKMLGDTKLHNGDKIISIEAPKQAFDAAAVPIVIRQSSGSDKRIEEITIVVDENPMPEVAKFKFGSLISNINLETRVRYDVFSNIRVIAKSTEGKNYMVGRFVKAAGGCSAPVSRDVNTTLKTIGQMKLKEFRDPNTKITKQSGNRIREVQLMIRHPNFTGMQLKAGTLDYIEPRFLDKVEVKLGDDLLFKMTGGFSLSENPSFRFKFRDNGVGAITVNVSDTSNATYSETFSLFEGL